jgi:lysophospholipase L1-like esterase
MRIVFLGDSLTWGGYGGNFVPYVADQLPAHTIINAGIAGDTVVNLLNRLDDVLTTHEPDAIFVMVGGNDAVTYSMPATRNYYRRAKNIADGIVTPEQFESTYRELLLQIQLQFIQPLVGLAPTEYSRELAEVKRLYNERAQAVANSLNIPVLDLDSAFTPDQPLEREPVTLKFIQEIGARASSGWSEFAAERDKWGYQFTFDGMHLMPETAPLFADQIVPFLQTHLRL